MMSESDTGFCPPRPHAFSHFDGREINPSSVDAEILNVDVMIETGSPEKESANAAKGAKPKPTRDNNKLNSCFSAPVPGVVVLAPTLDNKTTGKFSSLGQSRRGDSSVSKTTTNAVRRRSQRKMLSSGTVMEMPLGSLVSDDSQENMNTTYKNPSKRLRKSCPSTTRRTNRSSSCHENSRNHSAEIDSKQEACNTSKQTHTMVHAQNQNQSARIAKRKNADVSQPMLSNAETERVPSSTNVGSERKRKRMTSQCKTEDPASINSKVSSSTLSKDYGKDSQISADVTESDKTIANCNTVATMGQSAVRWVTPSNKDAVCTATEQSKTTLLTKSSKTNSSVCSSGPTFSSSSRKCRRRDKVIYDVTSCNPVVAINNVVVDQLTVKQVSRNKTKKRPTRRDNVDGKESVNAEGQKDEFEYYKHAFGFYSSSSPFANHDFECHAENPESRNQSCTGTNTRTTWYGGGSCSYGLNGQDTRSLTRLFRKMNAGERI